MKRLLSLLFLSLIAVLTLQAQDTSLRSARMRLYNMQYDVFMELDLEQQNLSVPGHDLYGPLAGYMGKVKNSFYWLIVSAEQKDGYWRVQMVNDYGSEDLTATLRQLNDSVVALHHEKGSTLKLPHQGKWQKMPKKLFFKIAR